MSKTKTENKIAELNKRIELARADLKERIEAEAQAADSVADSGTQKNISKLTAATAKTRRARSVLQALERALEKEEAKRQDEQAESDRKQKQKRLQRAFKDLEHVETLRLDTLGFRNFFKKNHAPREQAIDGSLRSLSGRRDAIANEISQLAQELEIEDLATQMKNTLQTAYLAQSVDGRSEVGRSFGIDVTGWARYSVENMD